MRLANRLDNPNLMENLHKGRVVGENVLHPLLLAYGGFYPDSEKGHHP